MTSVRRNSARPGKCRTLPRLTECRQGAFQQVHLGEGQEKREGRFGALIPVDTVFLKTVAAPAGPGVVQLLAQVVAAQEPLERGAGLVQRAAKPARSMPRAPSTEQALWGGAITRDTRTPVRRSNDTILRSACAAIAVDSATDRGRANSSRT